MNLKFETLKIYKDMYIYINNIISTYVYLEFRIKNQS